MPRKRGASKQDPDDILTIDELAVYLKLSKSTLCKLAQERKLPGQKVGRHGRFRREALDRWLERTPDVGAQRRGEEKA